MAPLKESLDTDEAFYLVYRHGQSDSGVSKRFRDWLETELTAK